MLKIRRKIAIALIVTIVLGGLTLWIFGYRNVLAEFERFTRNLGSSGSVSVGSPAPDFEAESLSGSRIKLSDLRGVPVILNFWATWCAPCVLEMPGIERSHQKYPGKFEVIAVNAGESAFKIKQFVKDIGITFNVVFDPDQKIQELYNISGYPTTYILDANGIILVRHIGQLDEDQLTRYLSQIGISQ